MNHNKVDRRNFISKAFLSGIALMTTPGYISCSKADHQPPLVKEKALLGRTGIEIPRISVGLGSRFCSIDSEEQSLQILNYALDQGLFAWDTAFSYRNNSNMVISEERVGKVLKTRRKEVFITTKFGSRIPDTLMQNIEESLKRLQIDCFDNIMIHGVTNMNDVNDLSKKGGIIELFERLRSEGVTRFIGFSSHSNATAIEGILRKGDFDTMLMALNQYGGDDYLREELIPKAVEKGIGVLLMKAVRPKETTNLNAEDLIRFALSIDGAAGVVVGMDSREVVESNVRILKNQTPLTKQQKIDILSGLIPHFSNKDIEWRQEGYRDGNWNNIYSI